VFSICCSISKNVKAFFIWCLAKAIFLFIMFFSIKIAENQIIILKIKISGLFFGFIAKNLSKY
jgi:hypothetical protein